MTDLADAIVTLRVTALTAIARAKGYGAGERLPKERVSTLTDAQVLAELREASLLRAGWWARVFGRGS